MLSVLTARRTLGRSLVGLVLDAASLECTLPLGLRVVACCVLNGLLRLLRCLRHYRVGHVVYRGGSWGWGQSALYPG